MKIVQNILPSVSKPTIDSCRNGFYQGARPQTCCRTSRECNAEKIRLCTKILVDLEQRGVYADNVLTLPYKCDIIVLQIIERGR